MDATLYKPALKSAHLISDLPGLSKDDIILSGASFVSGEVLGINTANDAFIKLDLNSGAAEGQVAMGVLWGDVDATETDQEGVAHMRLTAVRLNNLVWPAAITDPRKAEFLAELVANNIIPR